MISRRRVLWIKLGALGDVLMVTPALRAWARAHPEAKIDFLVGRHAAGALRGRGEIERIVEVEEAWFRPSGLFRLLGLIFRLRAERYDEVYLFHRHLLHHWFASSLGARCVAERRRRFGIWGAETWREGTHHVEMFARIAGVTLEDRSMRFGADPSPRRAEGLKIALNPGGGTNPGESVTVRQWPEEKWVELAKRILAECGSKIPGLELTIEGGPSDRPLAKRIETAVGDPRVVCRAGEGDLAAFRARLDGLHLFVTGDTGGMHMSAAAGVPVVAIFGPTDPEEKAPLDPSATVVWNRLPCGPCYRGRFAGCTQSVVGRCLVELGVGDVFEALRPALEEAARVPRP